jgi:hypothetical protein
MIKKKLAILSIFFVMSVSIVVAAPSLIQQPTTLNLGGTFDGNIGYKRQNQDPTVVGTILGSYEIRNRGGIFTGNWVTENRTGTFRGIFAKHIIIGKITSLINGTDRSLPIVGFYGGRDGQFIGRFMAPVGPALYFWGNYV